MQTRKEELQEKAMGGFFGFWIKNYRLSYLIVLTVIIFWMISVMNIPKESNPSVNLGMIMISVWYPWASPEDVDASVVTKIYQSVESAKWVDSIDATSSLGFWSLMLTLKTDADSKDVLSDVKSRVDSVSLPSDATTPSVTEILTDTSTAFTFALYEKNNHASRAELMSKAQEIKKRLEAISTVNSVNISTNSAVEGTVSVGNGGESAANYKVEILIPHETLANYGLSLADISNSINSYNLDMPIGNFTIGDKSYDFRIEGKNQNATDYLDTPISLPKGGTIKLGDIATLKRTYKDTSESQLLIGSGSRFYNTIALTVNKKDNVSIFQISNSTKGEIAKIFQEQSFANYGYTYTYDLAKTIIEDYQSLMKEAITTIVLVFVVMMLFVGFRDSLFATITLPLAFLSTFILLDLWGYSMNFLTNFSLILSFGIAIDTIIVIVQAASTKLRIWYDPRTALSLAIKEYAVPIISGVLTTIVVFIPLMALPGIMGKFLAYIPITIFWVLAFGLVLALTVNSSLYLLVIRKKKTYIDDPNAIEYASDEEKELLMLEREGKTPVIQTQAPLRTRVIHQATEWYKKILTKFLKNTILRRLSILIPVVIFFVGSAILFPMVGFHLFPEDDNNITTFTISGPVGTTTENMDALIGDLTPIFSGYPEIDNVSLKTSGNSTSIQVSLTNRDIRKSLVQKDVFAITDEVRSKLKVLEEKWLTVNATVASQGPPSSWALGIKLITNDSAHLDELIRVAKDMEKKVKEIPWTRDVTISSKDTPGQFIFHVNKDRAIAYGITPSMITNKISQSVNGIKVWTVKDNQEDMDIVVKDARFSDDVSPDMVLDLPFTIGQNTYRIGDFVSTTPKNALQSISRSDGDIQISVNAELQEWANSTEVSSAITDLAAKYKYPEGITYSMGGEVSENSDLIIALFAAFFIAITVIFAILTLQFNSFSQPVIILYSVVMALPAVLFWLLVTGNSFSLMAAIGFIAFTGIAINHGIILIDAINRNLKKEINGFTALVEAGASRLEPMVLTTFTAVFGLLPIALKDKFWSGMGFTIIFGIMATTFLTLFVVKGIYYEVYIRERKKIPLWKRVILLPIAVLRFVFWKIKTIFKGKAHRRVTKNAQNHESSKNLTSEEDNQ